MGPGRWCEPVSPVLGAWEQTYLLGPGSLASHSSPSVNFRFRGRLCLKKYGGDDWRRHLMSASGFHTHWPPHRPLTNINIHVNFFIYCQFTLPVITKEDPGLLKTHIRGLERWFSSWEHVFIPGSCIRLLRPACNSRWSDTSGLQWPLCTCANPHPDTHTYT